jgi:3-oxoadipate enol-lactonase
MRRFPIGAMQASFLDANGVRIAYEAHGDAGPWVTLTHSLGCSRHMFAAQVAAFSRTHRVLVHDLRGHGDSTSTDAPGTLDLLVDDLLALLDHLGIATTHHVGVSVGGMVGQVLAASRPERVASLVLANTTCKMAEPARAMWDQRIAQARTQGVASLAAPSLARWLTAGYREREPQAVEQLAQQFGKTSLAGYVSCCEAIRAVDTAQALATIPCPVLVIAGAEDVAASPEVARAMHEKLRDSQLVVLENTAHLSNLEDPAAFNAVVGEFLARQSGSGAKAVR